jgi:tripartite-type tricarboxylate transporter receptor subunit TctC
MLIFIRNRLTAQWNIAGEAITVIAIGMLWMSMTNVHAQGVWPTKPVTIIVPFAPGGGTDLGARLLAQKLTVKWGQSWWTTRAVQVALWA